MLAVLLTMIFVAVANAAPQSYAQHMQRIPPPPDPAYHAPPESFHAYNPPPVIKAQPAPAPYAPPPPEIKAPPPPPAPAYAPPPEIKAQPAPQPEYAPPPEIKVQPAPAPHYNPPPPAYDQPPKAAPAPMGYAPAPVVKAEAPPAEIYMQLIPSNEPYVRKEPEYPPVNMDYVFNYKVDDAATYNHQERHEEKHGHVVKGHYTLFDPDGSHRIVKYIADENGFRAEVVTTAPNPARIAQYMAQKAAHYA